MSTFSDKIELYKIRSFGDLISDTFSFTRKNFKPLFSGLFYIASPALLLSVVFGFLFYTRYLSFSQDMTANYFGTAHVDTNFFGSKLGFIVSIFSYMALMGFFFYVAFSLIIATTYSYIKLYAEDNERKITVTELWQSCRKYIWKIMGAQLLLFFVVILAFAVFLTPLLGGRGGIFFVFILFFAFLFLGLFYAIKLSFFPLFIVVEDNSIMQSFRSSYQFMNGIFWKALGLMFVLSLIVGVGMNILGFPGTIISISAVFGVITYNNFWILLESALTSVGTAVGLLLYAVAFIGRAMLYYSEMENRYGISSRREIEEIGKN